MGQGSPGFFDHEEDQDGADALPMSVEERASTDLRSPDFQRTAPDPVPEVQVMPTPAAAPPAITTAVSSTADAPAEDLVVLPSSPLVGGEQREVSPAPEPGGTGAGAPLAPPLPEPPQPLLHRRAVDDRDEAAIQTRDQQIEATQGAGYMRHLKNLGVETRIDPDGIERIDTHEDGAPKYRQEKQAPKQGADGRWFTRFRNDRGQVEDVDILANRLHSTDPQTGERYIEDPVGRRISLGVDQAVMQRRRTLEARSLLSQQQAAERLAVEQMTADLAEPRKTLKQLRESTTDFGTVGELEQAMLNRSAGALNPDEDDEALKEKAAALRRWMHAHPEYVELRDKVDTTQREVLARRQRMRQREALSLQISSHQRGAEVASLLPESLRLNANVPDRDAEDAQAEAAAVVADTGDSHITATRAALENMKARGVQSVAGKAIDDQIQALLGIEPQATQQPPLSVLMKSPEFEAMGTDQRVDRLKQWVDDSVRWARATDPNWNEEKEAAFRGRFIDRAGFWGSLRELGSGVWSGIVDRFPEDIARIARGGDVPLRGDSWTDRWIAENQADASSRGTSYQQLAGSKLAEALQEGPKSLTTSLATGLGGAVTGAKIGSAVGAAGGAPVGGVGAVPGAGIGGAVGAVIGAGALSGASFYRLAKDSFLERVRDELLSKNPNVTESEWEAAKAGVESEAQKYGLWEAGPEALSQAFTIGLFRGGGAIVNRLPGFRQVADGIAKSAIGGTLAKYGGVPAAKIGLEIGEELGTETATQFGQGGIEAKVGLRTKAPTIGEAFKEVAGPTTVGAVLQGGVMAAATRRRQDEGPTDVPTSPSRGNSGPTAGTSEATTAVAQREDESTAPQPQAQPQQTPEGDATLSGSRAQQYSTALASLAELQGKADTARANGDLASVAAMTDAAKRVEEALSEITANAIHEVPLDVRRQFAKAVDPATDFEANETFIQDNPRVAFGLASIGAELRGVYLTPERSAFTSRLIQERGITPAVADAIIDQHIGMRAAADLRGVLTGGLIEAPKAEALQRAGLATVVDNGQGGTRLVITDDALPLLPPILRRQVRENPGQFAFTSTPGAPLDVLRTHIRGGQERFGEVIRAAEPKRAAPQGQQRYTVRVRFTGANDNIQREWPVEVTATSADEALAKATAIGQKGGRKVLSVEVTAAENSTGASGPTPPQQNQTRPADDGAKMVSDVRIENLEEIIRNGGGTVQVSYKGQLVPFRDFVLAIEDDVAEVLKVELATRGEATKGIGTLAYIQLGNALMEQGITLRSSNAQYADGRRLWDRLVQMGHAERTSSGQYRWKDPNATDPADDLPAAKAPAVRFVEDVSELSPQARQTLMAMLREIGANRELIDALGINPLAAHFADRGLSGVMMRGNQLLMDGDLLAEQQKSIEGLGSSFKEWIRGSLSEEIVHRAQFIAEGRAFRATYEAIWNDSLLPEGLRAAARESYEGFDGLSDAAKGAEVTRMVIQQRWKGNITEAIFRAIQHVIEYLRGLDVQSSPLLNAAVERAEAVLREAESRVAERQSESIVTEAPYATASETESAPGDGTGTDTEQLREREAAASGIGGRTEEGGGIETTQPQRPRGEDKETDRLAASVATPSKAPSVRSVAFKRWFGQSKVVNEKGKPMVVYHGSPSLGSNGLFKGFDSEVFGVTENVGDLLAGAGAYFTTDKATAQTYTLNRDLIRSGGTVDSTEVSANTPVMSVYLRIEKPFDADEGWDDAVKILVAEVPEAAARPPGSTSPQRTADEVWREDMERMRSSFGALGAYKYLQGRLVLRRRMDKWARKDELRPILQKYGFDGITHVGGQVAGGGQKLHQVWVAWSPNQIKSAAHNSGAFDPANESMLAASPTPTAEPTPAAEGSQEVDERKFFGPIVRMGITRLYQGTADVLERTPGLEFLGNAIRKHVDTARQLQAMMTAPYRAWEQKYSRRVKKQALAEFQKFQQYADSEHAEDAQELLRRASPAAKELIDLWRESAALANKLNQEFQLQVFDANTGKLRPIGTVTDYFPRTIRPDILELLQDPTRNPKQWKEVVRALIANGHIESENQAHSFLSKAFNTTKSFDYLGNIEAARQVELPTMMYDYSFDAARRYLVSWSERMAQIQAYGQGAGKEGDLFDEAMRITINKPTQEYIAAVRDRAYGVSPNNFWARMANALNQIATATMLGNPITVGVNLISGLGYNSINMGVTPALRAVWDLRKAGQAINDAYEIGVLQDDLMRMMQDADSLDTGWQKRLREGTASVLKWTGYNASEEFVRAHGLLTAKAFLRQAIKANEKPDSRAALQYRDFMARHHIDADALFAENGRGEETNKFFRSVLNTTQGGYRFDQVPVFVDTALGRFLFKYQKWGTQQARMFMLHVVGPLRRGNVAPFLRYAFITALLGAGIDELKELLFGMPERNASLEEIGKTLNEDQKRGLELLAGKTFNSMISAGAMGIIGNYVQSFRDIAERSRFKNPMEPPGISVMKNVGETLFRLREQGTLTARDFDDLMRAQLSLYRTVESSGARALDAFGVDFRAKELEMRRQDLQWLGVTTRRFADEIGVEASRTSLGRVARTPETPLTRRLFESLSIGDTAAARETVNEILGQYKSQSDKHEALKRLQQQVRARQPVRVGAAGEARRELFLRWAQRRLPAADVLRIREVDQTYRKTATSLRLMAPAENVSTAEVQKALQKITMRKRAG